MEKISIIIPAYNEERRIEKTLEAYLEYFKKKVREKEISDFEIIVVINNTCDKTPEICEKTKKKNPALKILNFKEAGKGFAIIEGFKDALKRKNELIGFVDADLATPPKAFYDLFRKIGNHDGIIASRRLKGSKVIGKSLVGTIKSSAFNFIIRSLFLFNYRDTQCGAKLFHRKVLEEVTEKIGNTKWTFDVDLLYQVKKNKFRIKEIPTFWIDKEGSKHQDTLTNLIKSSFRMLAAAFRIRLINSPFKFIVRFYDKYLQTIYPKAIK